MIKLFLDNFKVLATHPSQYGETEVLEMKINLVPGVILYKSRVRLLNPDQKENLRNKIEGWLEQGVNKPSVSPWASSLVPVKKKDGRTRWVTDLRELNKQTVKDSYPLTNIQEILHSLQGATVFSSLDASGAYHAVRIVAVLVQPLLARSARSSTSGCLLGWPTLEACTAGRWT